VGDKPHNWSYMTTDEQAAWNRLDRAREDENFRRLEAEENLEREQRDARRAREEARNELANERDQRAELVEQLQTANSRWDRARKFLEEKGLTEEFNEWDLKVIADDDEE
jgi:uncharacterized surface protein with fasciclin (FAS1) repeats